MDKSILAQELEPLNVQIEQLQLASVELEDGLRGVEEELDSFAIDQQHIEILRDTCRSIDRLQELGVGELFWAGLPEGAETSHNERLWTRIAAFEIKTRDLKESRESLQEKIDQNLIELEGLFDDVQQAHAREERRQDEFLVERQMPQLSYRPVLMPWAVDAESEKRFRRTLLIAMSLCFLFGILVPLITVPLPDPSRVVFEVPERIAMLVKKELSPPAPVPEKPQAKKIEPEKKKTEDPDKKNKPKKAPKKTKPKVKPAGDGTKIAKKKAKKKVRNVGVLAFKSSFADLMDEVPVAKLGTEARLKKSAKKISGQARAQRSLVTSQAKGGSSGGINNYEVSRNLGNGGKDGGSGYGNAGEIGEIGTAKVESALAGLTEATGRPLSDGLGAARTDEEIQIIFDRYKATLYRIYNKELRKDPTLRGKLLLRLTIEPSGEVSLCEMESTDLASPELVAKIVARVKRFNFGQKDGVPQITILYPIDFLPAG